MPDFAVRTMFSATDRISPAFGRMGNAAVGFRARASRAISGVGRALRNMMPLFSAVAVVQFANRSIQAFNRQEAAVANVEAGLRSTNNAIGLTSRQLQTMASDLQSAGIFGDEEILQNATAQFLTFGNIGASNLQRIQTATTDVVAKLYGVNATAEQLRTTSIMMGRAMDDPIRGLTAMRRIGISFSDQEAVMIRQMIRANNTVGAQNAMLQIIERQYGGTNARLAQTNAGMDRLASNRMGDTMEEIGRQIVPLKRAFMDFAVWLLPKINALIPVFVEFLKSIAPLVTVIVAGFIAYKAALKAVAFWKGVLKAMEWAKEMRDWISIWNRSRKAIGFFNATIKGTVIWETILAVKTRIMAAAQWLFNTALLGCPIVWIIVGIVALIAAIVLLVRNWDTVKAKILMVWEAIKEKVQMVVGYLTGLFERFGDAGFMDVMIAPINLLISQLRLLFTVAARIPRIGQYFQRAADSIGEYQSAANQAMGTRNLFAPNQAQQGQQVRLQGEINIAGAPPGSTARVTRGAEEISMIMMGVNP